MRNGIKDNLYLRKDTSCVEIGKNTIIMAGGRSCSTVKMTGLASEIAKKLMEGESYDNLFSILSINYKNKSARQIQLELDKYISRLMHLGFVDRGPGERATKVPGKVIFPNPDPYISVIGRQISNIPELVRWSFLFIIVLVSAAQIILCAESISVKAMILDLNFSQILFCICIGVPTWWAAHEVAHALTCRTYGCPISGAGLYFRTFFIPSPFIDTSAARIYPKKLLLAQIAVAGPSLDIILLGAQATIITSNSLSLYWKECVTWWFLFTLFGLYCNLSPFRRSDGYTVIEELITHWTVKRDPNCIGNLLNQKIASRTAWIFYSSCYILTGSIVFLSLIS